MGRTTTAARLPVVIAVAGALAAACGTPGQGLRAAQSRTPVPARVVVPPGGSAAGARRAGRRLLARLILPAGSRRIAPRSRPPRSELIGGPDVVDVSRFYWLPLPEGAAVSFLQHHVPAGTRVAGTGTYADAFEAVQYSLEAPPAGIDHFGSELLATLAAGPDGGALLRADAELTWYPPRSAAEHLSPSGYRSVTVTVTLTSPSARAEPRAITRVFTSQVVIGRLARLLDGMHAAAPWTGSCPIPLPQFRIVFAPTARGNGQAATVLVTPSGCRGEIITTGGTPQPSLEDIDSTRLLAVIGPLLGVHHHYW